MWPYSMDYRLYSNREAITIHNQANDGDRPFLPASLFQQLHLDRCFSLAISMFVNSYSSLSSVAGGGGDRREGRVSTCWQHMINATRMRREEIIKDTPIHREAPDSKLIKSIQTSNPNLHQFLSSCFFCF